MSASLDILKEYTADGRYGIVKMQLGPGPSYAYLERMYGEKIDGRETFVVPLIDSEDTAFAHAHLGQGGQPTQ